MPSCSLPLPHVNVSLLSFGILRMLLFSTHLAAVDARSPRLSLLPTGWRSSARPQKVKALSFHILSALLMDDQVSEFRGWECS